MLKKIGSVELGLGLERIHRPAIVGVVRSLSISKLKKAKESGADIIELRMDFLKEEEKSIEKVKRFVEIEKNKVCLPIIVTNRSKEEGGYFEGTEEERIEMLASIIEAAEVDAVDIEFFAKKEKKKEIVEKAKKLHITLIFSYHNFEGMLRKEGVLRLVEGMYEEGGDIAKIAVVPKTLCDALLLLQLALNISSEGKLLSVIGMGEIGKHLRVITPIYGSALTYGFIEGEEEVVPGQLSVDDLKSILGKLYDEKGNKKGFTKLSF